MAKSDDAVQPAESRMYDDSIAGNPTVNETQVRRAGRLIDDRAAADALQAGNLQEAGSIQSGEAQFQEADTEGRETPSARNARESKSQTGETQSSRVNRKMADQSKTNFDERK